MLLVYADSGFDAQPYHAGLEDEVRHGTQDRFTRDRTAIIVATIAFGMGIDKPDIRLLVHYDLPKTLEGYYQETGRAGRDGLPSDCVLFFSHDDVPKLERFIGEIEDDDARENAYGKLDQVIEFCELRACRRRYLLRYFGEEWSGGNCGGCDFCLTAVEEAGEEFEEEFGEKGKDAILPLARGKRRADWAPARESEAAAPLLLKRWKVGKEELFLFVNGRRTEGGDGKSFVASGEQQYRLQTRLMGRAAKAAGADRITVELTEQQALVWIVRNIAAREIGKELRWIRWLLLLLGFWLVFQFVVEQQIWFVFQSMLEQFWFPELTNCRYTEPRPAQSGVRRAASPEFSAAAVRCAGLGLLLAGWLGRDAISVCGSGGDSFADEIEEIAGLLVVGALEDPGM